MLAAERCGYAALSLTLSRALLLCSKFRHPGYMGWFWYTVGTQIILGNPICIAGFAYASYKFFADRIEDEEEKLVEFFGQRYVDYRSRTIVGIPGIK